MINKEHNTEEVKLLTPEEAATFLRTTPQVLSVWRSTKQVDLKFIKLGRKVLYRYSDLIEYLEKNTKNYA